MKQSILSFVALTMVFIGTFTQPDPVQAGLLGGLGLNVNLNLNSWISARAGCGRSGIQLANINSISAEGLINLSASVNLDVNALADVYIGLFSRSRGPVYTWPTTYRFQRSRLAVQLNLKSAFLGANVQLNNDLFIGIWTGQRYNDGFVWPWGPSYYGSCPINASIYKNI
ncbi:hypothetical protein BDF19DRAFT_444149 [Syncephalis fuscata]|nr:hypothetical protein BDF19DRAFT_444149 [Syncephalis fuscata]